MEITGEQIWQVAAGDTNRNYADMLVYWDVIVDGPGEVGPWQENKKELTEKKRDLKRFCEEMKEGDTVLLRMGTSDVLAVGHVVGPYQWLDDFGDVDGWDLQHVRRVKWMWKKCGGNPPLFEPYTLKWGDTVQPVSMSPVLKEWLQDLQPNLPSTELRSLPEKYGHGQRLPSVETDEISDFLFDRGVAASSVDMLANQLGELIRIARWYDRKREFPSESETIAYLIIPLLRTLGWTPQRMAVEWNNVDVALFGTLPRNDSNLVVTVEAKRKGSSCLTAKSQAETYAERECRRNCQRLIVTDGTRYGVFVRDADQPFPDQPAAYFNLLRLVESYPILGMDKTCDGPKHALLMMAADWNRANPE